MLEHGGRLRAAVAQYGRPLADWLDLSTGINPSGWPVPPLPAAVWQRLPEDNDGLEEAAAAYYGNANLLPVAGSQAAIQVLPKLFQKQMLACATPLYNEHPAAWLAAGHRVRHLGGGLKRCLNAMTPGIVLCNPNNPTATAYSRGNIVDAADQLAKRGGWLLVDEAFADPAPELSVADLAGTAEAPNLMVLRSLGKFFGLAGIRVGFVLATPERLASLRELLGPWTVSGPSRAVARLALSDTVWQTQARQQLQVASERLHSLLAPLGTVSSSPLFCTLSCEQTAALFEHLARHAILVRQFPDLSLLRFGLPGEEAAWQRLGNALAEWRPEQEKQLTLE
jgi:cobalamin biosynthetic protein CobC